MEKEEILEKSREQNKKADPYETYVSMKSADIGIVAGLIVALIVWLYDTIMTGTPNMSVLCVWNAITAADNLYKYIKLKKSTFLFIALLTGILDILLFIYVILEGAGVF